MLSRRAVLGLGVGLGVLAASGGAVGLAFRGAMAEAGRAVAPRRSLVVPSRHGTLEYAVAGAGPPLLMVHGTGGGFDQGLSATRRLVDAGYRIIAPSRFGYLRSAYPADPSSENQADAFVDLLDALGIDRVAIAGGSAGALSALQFAIRHPDRCAALIALVPATHAPARPTARPWSPTQVRLAEAVLRSDFLFWSALSLAPELMIETLLATDAELVRTASYREEERVRDMLWHILPVSRRADGLLNDSRLTRAPGPMELERIAAPTLAISLEDDRFGTADAARHIASAVAGAKLVIYPAGGHVWVGRDRELFAAIDAFLKHSGYA